MIQLLRKITQTTYTFAITQEEKEYIATFIYNDASGKMISHHISFKGERVDEEKEDEIVDQILMAHPEGFPK